MFKLAQITIVRVEFYPCEAGAADTLAPQVWMVDLLRSRQCDLLALCPLESS